jgi:hypothetical protein
LGRCNAEEDVVQEDDREGHEEGHAERQEDVLRQGQEEDELQKEVGGTVEHHTQIKSRQVKGTTKVDDSVPAVEQSPSCAATMYGGMNRGNKFDDNGPNVEKQGRMEEEHTSRTR